MKKLLFLDIDGVVVDSNHNKTQRKFIKQNPQHHFQFKPSLMERLQLIIQNTEADIILSSSWRLNKKNTETVVQQLRKYKMVLSGRTESLGPDNNQKHYECRVEEIVSYLSKNPCDRFAILDDYPMLDRFPNNQVLCHWNWGFTWGEAVRAIKILNS